MYKGIILSHQQSKEVGMELFKNPLHIIEVKLVQIILIRES